MMDSVNDLMHSNPELLVGKTRMRLTEVEADNVKGKMHSPCELSIDFNFVVKKQMIINLFNPLFAVQSEDY